MSARRLVLGLVAGLAAASFAAPAEASLTCRDLGPVPGFGPVCTVQCFLGQADVNVKDIRGTVESVLFVVCPA